MQHVAFTDSSSRPAALVPLVEQLKTCGVAFSAGHREGDLAAIADGLGRTIQITDVESDRALPLHTDHHAARYVGLVLRAASGCRR